MRDAISWLTSIPWYLTATIVVVLVLWLRRIMHHHAHAPVSGDQPAGVQIGSQPLSVELGPVEPASSEVVASVGPSAALEMYVGGAHQKTKELATQARDGLLKLQRVSMDSPELATPLNPPPSSSPDQKGQVQPSIEQVSANLAAAESALKQASWRQIWALVHKLRDGDLVADGIAKPDAMQSVRIDADEWRHYKMDEQKLVLGEVVLGERTYTGVVIGKPE